MSLCYLHTKRSRSWAQFFINKQQHRYLQGEPYRWSISISQEKKLCFLSRFIRQALKFDLFILIKSRNYLFYMRSLTFNKDWGGEKILLSDASYTSRSQSLLCTKVIDQCHEKSLLRGWYFLKLQELGMKTSFTSHYWYILVLNIHINLNNLRLFFVLFSPYHLILWEKNEWSCLH